MTVECITCDRLCLREHPAQAKHTQASEKTVAARRAWMAKKAGRA